MNALLITRSFKRDLGNYVMDASPLPNRTMESYLGLIRRQETYICPYRLQLYCAPFYQRAFVFATCNGQPKVRCDGLAWSTSQREMIYMYVHWSMIESSLGHCWLWWSWYRYDHLNVKFICQYPNKHLFFHKVRSNKKTRKYNWDRTSKK